MKIEFRLISAAVIAAILISPIVARAGSRSHPLSEDAALDLLDARLSATASTKSESHWIASRTAPKRRRTHILNSFSAKFTTPNAVAIPKQVLLLTVTAFTAIPAKSSSGKQLTTSGSRISARQTR
jgi:hypothetical protein